MRKIVLFMHVSLDGYVAGPNGAMNWIKVDDEIFSYAGDQTDQADTAIYGRVTFDMMQADWPNAGNSPGASEHDIQHSSWYNSVQKIVVSRTLPREGLKGVSVLDANIGNRIAALKQQEGRNMLMFGSPSVAHILMDGDLIDDYWVFINPVILGSGIPLFQGIREKTALSLKWSRQFKCGVVGLHYEKNNSSN